jgi:NAD(P)-dependent dehydrogenase (short-subunit alcohol dehydrogenase family)
MAAANGYAVGVNYARDHAAARDVVEQIRSAGGQAAAIQADVGNETEVRAMFDMAEVSLGRISALVNNAGIVDRQTTLTSVNAERFERILRTNVIGAFHCAKEAVARMSFKSGGQGGAIVNVSSVAARTGSPFEYADYAASKGALDSMTAGLAREVAPLGIRVNTVRPGFICTDMHADGGEPGRVDRLAPGIPLGRGGYPGEVARGILWLCSDEAGYVVGTTLDVAGGV